MGLPLRDVAAQLPSEMERSLTLGRWALGEAAAAAAVSAKQHAGHHRPEYPEWQHEKPPPCGILTELLGNLPDQAHAQSPHRDDRARYREHQDRIEDRHGYTVTPQHANYRSSAAPPNASHGRC